MTPRAPMASAKERSAERETRLRPSRLARFGDPLLRAITVAGAASVLLVTGWLVWEMYIHSAESRHAFGWKFLVTQEWDPVFGEFGALPFIYGTTVTAFVALLMALPLGVGTAVFLSELAPRRISSLLAFLIDLLAAVPSVIYGLLGIFLLVPFLSSTVVPVLQRTLGFLPFLGGPFYGVSLFSASVVLTVMIVPFIVSISREVILAVPREQRDAALALGATKWEMVRGVVLPQAQRGIYGSAFLALARALGETMAVTMVVGNVPQIAKSLMAPGYTIAAVIANEFTEATGDLYLSALIELGLVLFGITLVINGLARMLILTLTTKVQHE